MIWIKEFKDAYHLREFYWDSKFFRTCIMVKFHKDRNEIRCDGFYFFDRFEIYPDKILNSLPIESEPYNRDRNPMIDREVFEKGFGEMVPDVKSKIGKKSG